MPPHRPVETPARRGEDPPAGRVGSSGHRLAPAEPGPTVQISLFPINRGPACSLGAGSVGCHLLITCSARGAPSSAGPGRCPPGHCVPETHHRARKTEGSLPSGAGTPQKQTSVPHPCTVCGQASGPPGRAGPRRAEGAGRKSPWKMPGKLGEYRGIREGFPEEGTHRVHAHRRVSTVDLLTQAPCSCPQPPGESFLR
ncbi:collagen alpha-2(I) chain-like [Lynx rufus]|uniref:collagen alpha-2(I) chain-like n=1 Tax=Lynx rufus TaxID=61384 RepID=UPI001F1230E9|nr:collagen alpha-2(I) chain-like [Lynx rufus]